MNHVTQVEWKAELKGFIEPYTELVLVDAVGDSKPHFEMRCGVPGLMLAPHRLDDIGAAQALLKFFISRSSFQTIKEERNSNEEVS